MFNNQDVALPGYYEPVSSNEAQKFLNWKALISDADELLYQEKKRR